MGSAKRLARKESGVNITVTTVKPNTETLMKDAVRASLRLACCCLRLTLSSTVFCTLSASSSTFFLALCGLSQSSLLLARHANMLESDTDFVVRLGPENHSWNVVRSEFDHLLIQHAENSGAKVFQGTKLTSIGFDVCQSESLGRPNSASVCIRPVPRLSAWIPSLGMPLEWDIMSPKCLLVIVVVKLRHRFDR